MLYLTIYRPPRIKLSYLTLSYLHEYLELEINSKNCLLAVPRPRQHIIVTCLLHDCQMSAADAASLHAKFKSKMQIEFLALRLGEKKFKFKKKY